ncbi:hypothetical protein J14TS5_04440 [Paenibacillus lautus]|nr:hypothetical protein J14TS5_04440 [Paenibacillus lautus]
MDFKCEGKGGTVYEVDKGPPGYASVIRSWVVYTIECIVGYIPQRILMEKPPGLYDARLVHDCSAGRIGLDVLGRRQMGEGA